MGDNGRIIAYKNYNDYKSITNIDDDDGDDDDDDDDDDGNDDDDDDDDGDGDDDDDDGDDDDGFDDDDDDYDNNDDYDDEDEDDDDDIGDLNGNWWRDQISSIIHFRWLKSSRLLYHSEINSFPVPREILNHSLTWKAWLFHFLNIF